MVGKPLDPAVILQRSKDKYPQISFEGVVFENVDSVVVVKCTIHDKDINFKYNVNVTGKKSQPCEDCRKDKISQPILTKDESKEAISAYKKRYPNLNFKDTVFTSVGGKDATVECTKHKKTFNNLSFANVRGMEAICVECQRDNKAEENATDEKVLTKLDKFKADFPMINLTNTKFNIEKTAKTTAFCDIHKEEVSMTYSENIGRGRNPCKQCGGRGVIRKMTRDEFIRQSREMHGDKYNYDKVELKGALKPVTITCPKHGDFEQLSTVHRTKKCGCPKCKNEKTGDRCRDTTESFIEKARRKHGDKFDYSQVVYGKDCDEPVTIICKAKNHTFEQTPGNHLTKKGCCRWCIASEGENTINTILKGWNITFNIQKTFDGCVSDLGKPLLFDFYIPDANLCIEYNGEQHYFANDMWGGAEGLLQRRRRDNIKVEYCDNPNNNIALIIIKYDQDIPTKMAEIKTLCEAKGMVINA